MNADSNPGFAASPRQLGLVAKRIRLLAAAAATRTTTQTQNNECALTSASCVVAVAMLAWCPRERARAPQIEDERVPQEGALRHASYHFVFTKAACTDLYRNFSSSMMP